jgi:hypothetical protein
VAGDAVDAVGDLVLAVPAGVTPVVTTTWMLAYLLPERRRAFEAALAAASRVRPVAWISAESAGVVDRFAGVEAPTDAQGTEASLLGLLVFDDGEPAGAELLAFVHPHGLWIDWRA